MKKKIKVGIVGCGTIGSAIARYCARELSDSVNIYAVFDTKRENSELIRGICANAIVAESLDGLIKESDLIIEAASKDVVGDVIRKAFMAKKDVMIMSVGGLLNDNELLSLAGRSNCRLYIPSGAVCGLDGVKAAALSRIDSVVLTTKKPKEGLKGAPYLKKENIDLDSIDTETLLFEGSAEDAVRAFPKNINVSAALSLAGIGAKDTRVRIVCSPNIDKNIHELHLKGEFGELMTRTENIPSPDNPKTSFLAALSAMALLKGIVNNIRVGT